MFSNLFISIFFLTIVIWIQSKVIENFPKKSLHPCGQGLDCWWLRQRCLLLYIFYNGHHPVLSFAFVSGLYCLSPSGQPLHPLWFLVMVCYLSPRGHLLWLLVMVCCLSPRGQPLHLLWPLVIVCCLSPSGQPLHLLWLLVMVYCLWAASSPSMAPGMVYCLSPRGQPLHLLWPLVIVYCISPSGQPLHLLWLLAWSTVSHPVGSLFTSMAPGHGLLSPGSLFTFYGENL